MAAAARLPQLSGQAYLDWSLRYQLVTEETDYLITVERAEAERASELPELHVVPQMLAAGWGGTGSVASGGIRASRNRAQMVMSYAANTIEDFNCDYDTPYAVRSRRNRPRVTENNWVAFVTGLDKLANRKQFAALPVTLADLIALRLPNQLVDILMGFLGRGELESKVVRIALNLIQEYIDVVYPNTVLAFIAKSSPDSPALVQSIRQAFDALDPTIWRDCDHATAEGN